MVGFNLFFGCKICYEKEKIKEKVLIFGIKVRGEFPTHLFFKYDIMKNIVFWAGLFIVTFWDEILLASYKPEKTKRQQQFLETGETAQAFIGAVNDPFVVTIFRKIFKTKAFKGNSKTVHKYSNLLYPTETLFEFRGGPENKGFNMILGNGNIKPEIHYPSKYGTYSYRNFYGKNKVEIERMFDDSGVFDIIWFEFLNGGNYSNEKLAEIPNYDNMMEIANSGNAELAFVLLSGVPNIKKILE
ncbi:hypothetical protein EBZ38_05385 [bacterium]|nr:hypothetical protein [bacterium]